MMKILGNNSNRKKEMWEILASRGKRSEAVEENIGRVCFQQRRMEASPGNPCPALAPQMLLAPFQLSNLFFPCFLSCIYGRALVARACDGHLALSAHTYKSSRGQRRASLPGSVLTLGGLGASFQL